VVSRILVTGGAGFLGSWLCGELLRRGDEVLCVDNFFTGSRRNVAQYLAHPNFEVMRHDITFPLYVEVDGIFNLACPASPVHYERDSVQTVKTCVHGSINMLGLAKRCRARILQASTSEVYGDPEVTPQPEEYFGNVNPIGPRSCYDEGKRCAETLFVSYLFQHGVNTVVARIFNTYGPGMAVDDGRVVSNFIVAALRGKPLIVTGTGEQTRCFCYVSEMVDGLIRLFDSKVHGPTNLGSGVEVSVLSLAETIIAMTGSKSKIHFVSKVKDDPRRRVPDIEQARKEIGWAPKVSLKDGLQVTIEYFKGLIK